MQRCSTMWRLLVSIKEPELATDETHYIFSKTGMHCLVSYSVGTCSSKKHRIFRGHDSSLKDNNNIFITFDVYSV